MSHNLLCEKKTTTFKYQPHVKFNELEKYTNKFSLFLAVSFGGEFLSQHFFVSTAIHRWKQSHTILFFSPTEAFFDALGPK